MRQSRSLMKTLAIFSAGTAKLVINMFYLGMFYWYDLMFLAYCVQGI
jgi:hypothetical protein